MISRTQACAESSAPAHFLCHNPLTSLAVLIAAPLQELASDMHARSEALPKFVHYSGLGLYYIGLFFVLGCTPVLLAAGALGSFVDIWQDPAFKGIPSRFALPSEKSTPKLAPETNPAPETTSDTEPPQPTRTLCYQNFRIGGPPHNTAGREHTEEDEYAPTGADLALFGELALAHLLLMIYFAIIPESRVVPLPARYVASLTIIAIICAAGMLFFAIVMTSSKRIRTRVTKKRAEKCARRTAEGLERLSEERREELKADMREKRPEFLKLVEAVGEEIEREREKGKRGRGRGKGKTMEESE